MLLHAYKLPVLAKSLISEPSWNNLVWRCPRSVGIHCTDFQLLLKRRVTLSVMAPKRKADVGGSSAVASKKAAVEPLDNLVDPKRVRILKDGDIGCGPVIYWYVSVILVHRQ